jgi:hypothetical protein
LKDKKQTVVDINSIVEVNYQGGNNINLSYMKGRAKVIMHLTYHIVTSASEDFEHIISVLPQEQFLAE